MTEKLNLMIDEIRLNLHKLGNSRHKELEEKYIKNGFLFIGVISNDMQNYMKEFIKKWIEAKPDAFEIIEFVNSNKERYDIDVNSAKLTKIYSIELAIKLAEKLYNEATYRDEQYFAVNLLKKYAKKAPEGTIKIYETMITKDAWWDNVDLIASNHIYEYFKIYPKERDKYIDKWSKSGKTWLIRATLLFQVKLKEKTDTELLFKLASTHKNSKDVFVLRGIGIALRELRRTNPKIVDDFLATEEGLQRETVYTTLHHRKSPKP